jgi:hypothetical protein
MALCLCLILSLILPIVTAVPVAARQEFAIAPLDLAAMALTPSDLADAGWDGLGLDAAQTLSATDLAYRAVWPAGAGAEEDAVRDALLAAGWQQGYTAAFATFWAPDRSSLGHQAEVEIVAYADAAGAAEGFSRIPDTYETGPAQPVAGSEQIGDETRLARVEARDPQAGTPSQELALGFRRDRLTARILLRDWTGEEPQVAVVEALAARLLERIEAVLQDGGPGLSLRVLRIEPLENAIHTDSYLRLDGEDVRSTYESPADLAARVSGYAGATDVYTNETEIATDDRGYTLGFGADLYAFSDADGASAWLREEPTRVKQGVDVTVFAIEDQNAGIGDEAITITMARDYDHDGMEVIHTSALLFRIGAEVAAIRLSRTNTPPPMSAVTELAADQAACLAAADCLRPQPAPESVPSG